MTIKKCLLTICWVMMPTVTLFAQTISSDNFVLKNAKGETTAQLTTSGEGTPGLYFYDSNRKIRITIGLYGDNVPTIVLNDENEKASAIMRLVTNQGNPVLVLKENGEDKLIIDKNGLPSSGTTGKVMPLALAALFGFLGGLLTLFFRKKEVVVPLQMYTTPIVPSPSVSQIPTPTAPLVA